MSKSIIDIFREQLPCANNDDFVWQVDDLLNMYTKYVQMPPHTPATCLVKPIQDAPDIQNQRAIEEIQDIKHTINPTVPALTVPTVAKENLNMIVTKTKATTATKPVKTTKDTTDTKPAKTAKTIKPLDVILRETNTLSIDLEHVKNKLIEAVSRPDYVKVFGVKKSAEIMSGIVNNRWNKSVALFISFLFDKTVVYNNEQILYNKNNSNNGCIAIA